MSLLHVMSTNTLIKQMFPLAVYNSKANADSESTVHPHVISCCFRACEHDAKT